jgi:hypothetical protein
MKASIELRTKNSIHHDSSIFQWDNSKNRDKLTLLTNKYMTVHFPGFVHALLLKASGCVKDVSLNSWEVKCFNSGTKGERPGYHELYLVFRIFEYVHLIYTTSSMASVTVQTILSTDKIDANKFKKRLHKIFDWPSSILLYGDLCKFGINYREDQCRQIWWKYPNNTNLIDNYQMIYSFFVSVLSAFSVHTCM